jgi:hypothetical protein
MPSNAKRGTAVKTKAKAKPAKTKLAKARAANGADIDGGGAPKGAPSGKAAKARPAAHDNSTSAGIPASILTKATALGARNGGAAPSLGGAKAGAPVRFVGSSAESAVQEFAAGAPPAELFSRKQ